MSDQDCPPFLTLISLIDPLSHKTCAVAGVADNYMKGPFSYSATIISTWTDYKMGMFVKRGERKISHVLASHAGQKYHGQNSYCVVFKFSVLEMDKHVLAS